MAKKKLPKSENDKLDILITLNQTLVALELSKGGLSQPEIGKILGMSTGSVNKIMKGYKPPKQMN
jgi:predicted transcriptional regulator